MPAARKRTVAFRIESDVVDKLAAAGVSASRVARDAVYREARRQSQRAALERLKAKPLEGGLGFNAVDFVRQDRDAR